MPDFGTDIDGIYDIGLRFGLVSGNKNLGNALARRLTTPRGALARINPNYGPDYGFDIRQFLSASMVSGSVSQLQSSIAAECQKDERVLSAQVTVVYNQLAQSATITIVATTAAGPFKLVLLVDNLTVQILSVST